MISFDDISLRVAGRLLIDHTSAFIPDGARVGLVGRNGTGKTTLFHAITGDIALESGNIRIPQGARIGQVAQEAPAGPERLIDVVLAADVERARLMDEQSSTSDPTRIAEIELRLADIGAHAAPARAARILAGLGFDEAAQQRPCSDFSGGWRMRVALAAILFAEPDLLLLDEPTNYLDLEGTLWLQDYLARYPRTVLIVSHDRELLNASVSSILHLERAKLTLWRGGYDSFERQRAEKLVLDQKARTKQEAKRKHMEAFVERFRAKATKARQAQSRLKALARMAPIAEAVGEAAAAISIRHPERIPSPPILALDNVSVGYEPGHPILRNLTLRIDHDDRIALLGPNGNGKSTFAKLIAGRLGAQGGSLVRAAGLETAYLAQHQLDELVAEDTVYDHVRRLMPDAPEAKVRSRAAEFGFSGGTADTTIAALSGGEKARLLLGLATFNGPHLLILDEPTNHLDIAARQALIEALNDYPGAVILISHDRSLLDASAERLWLVADGTVRPYEGDLDEYQRLVVGRGASSQRKDSTSTRAEERRQAAERRAETAPIRKRIKDTEAFMSKLERSLSMLDSTLADEALYIRDPAKAQRAARERAEAAASLARAEEEWLELSAALESADGEKA
ncbi:ABC-F family ATP-binding cassette domain-containing protein [Ancylobacter pratisalsi]|uniref:ABC-F family ATP-binding cassette domain-containing protein n=1 Tax=Ancylobacter pratisalsi TaxID=1745854 RepID=A0A6P1YGS8_9HYPH|nr:ABC-F family ATP-binding cassette domain-containing protein [Ancylobacter pratisalsi]QIB32508.1 ABC-F family ATP-binding cassette domain-containing protein [Ancylobacter pratisalsi]